MPKVAPRTRPAQLRRLATYGDPRATNAVIRGDNVEVLPRLLPEMAGRFRLIYVDPPYNTGRTFKEYRDARRPEQWQSMMRERLALLRGRGAAPGRFRGVAPMPVQVTSREPGVSATAMLDVPADAPFFGDHFPRRPVFPATLLLDTQMRLAVDVAREADVMRGAAPRAVRMTHVKMRSFIVPGQHLAIDVKLKVAEGEALAATLSAKTGERTVATARLVLARDTGEAGSETIGAAGTTSSARVIP